MSKFEPCVPEPLLLELAAERTVDWVNAAFLIGKAAAATT